MNQKLKEAVDSVLAILAGEEQERKLSRSEAKLRENLNYFLRREGVKVERKRTGNRPYSELAKKFSQQGRESSIFRGSLAEAIKLREEALSDKEAVADALEEEVATEEEALLAEEEDSQVLATSEQKPKKRRGRKPKTNKEEE